MRSVFIGIVLSIFSVVNAIEINYINQTDLKFPTIKLNSEFIYIDSAEMRNDQFTFITDICIKDLVGYNKYDGLKDYYKTLKRQAFNMGANGFKVKTFNKKILQGKNSIVLICSLYRIENWKTSDSGSGVINLIFLDKIPSKKNYKVSFNGVPIKLKIGTYYKYQACKNSERVRITWDRSDSLECKVELNKDYYYMLWIDYLGGISYNYGYGGGLWQTKNYLSKIEEIDEGLAKLLMKCYIESES